MKGRIKDVPKVRGEDGNTRIQDNIASEEGGNGIEPKV